AHSQVPTASFQRRSRKSVRCAASCMSTASPSWRPPITTSAATTVSTPGACATSAKAAATRPQSTAIDSQARASAIARSSFTSSGATAARQPAAISGFLPRPLVRLASPHRLVTSGAVRALAVAVVLAASIPGAALALAPEALDPTVAWRLRALVLRGNRAVPAAALRAAMVTKARPWFAPWQRLPAFDPAAFAADLARLGRLYRSRGYYHAHVSGDVAIAGPALVTATIVIDEGPPVRVTAVAVRTTGATLPAAAVPALPLAAGAVFDEDAYARGEALLRAAYREQGYARVTVSRRARVDVARDTAEVAYTV